MSPDEVARPSSRCTGPSGILVFVRAGGLDGSDLDEHDLADAPSASWGSAEESGRRTSHEPDRAQGRWQGTARRAASIQDHRTWRPTGAGAVATAGARGGREMVRTSSCPTSTSSADWDGPRSAGPRPTRAVRTSRCTSPSPTRTAWAELAELARKVNCTCRGRGHRTRPVTVVAARSSTVDRSAPDRSASHPSRRSA